MKNKKRVSKRIDKKKNIHLRFRGNSLAILQRSFFQIINIRKLNGTRDKNGIFRTTIPKEKTEKSFRFFLRNGLDHWGDLMSILPFKRDSKSLLLGPFRTRRGK
jgi:hypothetical protein